MVKLNDDIIVDLFEEKFQNLEARIERDTQAFIQEEMWSLYWAFIGVNGNFTLLEEELRTLICLNGQPSPDSWVLVDEWTTHLFGKDDIVTVNRGRELLQYAYTEFEQSEVFQWICDRFELSKSGLLKAANSGYIFDWLVIWMMHVYPDIALFLLGKDKLKPYRSLKSVGIKNVFLYLPKFILWNIPACLTTGIHRLWVKKLAEGQNIRRIQGWTVPLTKRMAHWFANAPKECVFSSALGYGVVMGLNGNEYLYRIFNDFFIPWNKDRRFLKTMIDFFMKPGHQMQKNEERELLGYLQHLWDEHGKLSMKDWTMDTLRRRAAQWYDETNRMWYGDPGMDINQSWTGADYEPFELEEEEVKYYIIQLTSMQELYAEGRVMRHCVGGYGWKCLQEGTSIWSLRKKSKETSKSLVTIEVSKNHHIVQAKRKFNGQPDKFEWNLIRKWAELANLKCR